MSLAPDVAPSMFSRCFQWFGNDIRQVVTIYVFLGASDCFSLPVTIKGGAETITATPGSGDSGRITLDLSLTERAVQVLQGFL